jgi:hypothetical protein
MAAYPNGLTALESENTTKVSKFYSIYFLNLVALIYTESLIKENHFQKLMALPAPANYLNDTRWGLLGEGLSSAHLSIGKFSK